LSGNELLTNVFVIRVPDAQVNPADLKDNTERTLKSDEETEERKKKNTSKQTENQLGEVVSIFPHPMPKQGGVCTVVFVVKCSLASFVPVV